MRRVASSKWGQLLLKLSPGPLARPKCGLSVARYSDFARDSESADFFFYAKSPEFSIWAVTIFFQLCVHQSKHSPGWPC